MYDLSEFFEKMYQSALFFLSKFIFKYASLTNEEMFTISEHKYEKL